MRRAYVAITTVLLGSTGVLYGNAPAAGEGAASRLGHLARRPPATLVLGLPVSRGADLSRALDRAREWIRGEDDARDMNPIKAAQQALAEQGYDPGPADGVLGPKTRQAIRRFQEAQGLKVTGRLDAATMERLGAGKERGATNVSPGASRPPSR